MTVEHRDAARVTALDEDDRILFVRQTDPDVITGDATAEPAELAA